LPADSDMPANKASVPENGWVGRTANIVHADASAFAQACSLPAAGMQPVIRASFCGHVPAGLLAVFVPASVPGTWDWRAAVSAALDAS